MQAASTSFRAYAIDLWGFGDTARAAARYSLDRQVALLEGFLEQMGIGRVALIGHGLGALVAILAAGKFCEVVDRVMAVSCPLDETSINARLRTQTPAELADWLLARSPLADTARADAPKSDALAVRASLTNLAATGIWGLINTLPNPCLMVQGENDPAISPPPLERLAGLPQQTHQIVFDGSGHFPMLDEANKFNRLMADFFALFPGESPRNLQLKEEWVRRVR
jgi:pimeloyl-ACP methyl ester carboxylesterase